MAADPDLTPPDQNHILESTSVLRNIELVSKPVSVTADWTWQPLKAGGLLKVHHTASADVTTVLAAQ